MRIGFAELALGSVADLRLRIKNEKDAMLLEQPLK